MNPKKNYYNKFPKNRAFYLLDSYEKIKDFETTNFGDPEYICVISETNDKKIKEYLFKRIDFLNDFEFIKVLEKNSNVDLSFIISKTLINIGGRETRLLTEIKSRKRIMKEIERNTNINFNSNDNIFFKEAFSIPIELKFYNRIFTLYIRKQNLNIINNNQNQFINNMNHNYNNHIISENQDKNINNNFNNNNFNNNFNINIFSFNMKKF